MEEKIIKADLKESTVEVPGEREKRELLKKEKVSDLMENLAKWLTFTKDDISLSLWVKENLETIKRKTERRPQITVETTADQNSSIMWFTIKWLEGELQTTLRWFMQNLCIVLGITHEKAKPIYDKIKEWAEYRDLRKVTLEDLNILLTAVGRKNGNTKVVFKGESHT